MADGMEQETWRSNAGGLIFVKVRDPYDDRKMVDRSVGPGEALVISSEERYLNQSAYVNQKYDFFSNGMLEPVRLVETAHDFAEIQVQPNLKTESDLQDILKMSVTKLKKEIAEISSLTVIDRLITMADADDSMTAGKIKALDERREELDPSNDNYIGYHQHDDSGNPVPRELRLS